MYHYPNASKGIHQYFIGIILNIASIPLTFVLIGPLVAVAALVLQLIGLHTASRDDGGYQSAFYASLAELAVRVINFSLSQNAMAATVLAILSSLISLYITYTVITTTCLLLQGKDAETIARGQTVLKIYVTTTLVSVVCAVVSVIPIIGALAVVISILSAIVSMVGYVLFMFFLNRAYQSLA